MKIRAWVGVITLLAFAACEGETDSSAAENMPVVQPQSAKPQTVIHGIWELRYKDAAGQSYLNILELHEDGTYATHMRDATPSDAGRYTLSKTDIIFNSAVDSRLSQKIPYMLDGNELTLTLPGAGMKVGWKRSALKRQLPVMDHFGQHLPGDLPAKIAELMADAQRWQSDAVPTSIRLKALQNGEFETVLTVFAPSSQAIMRMTITPFDMATSIHDGKRASQTPLPPDVLDLPLILIKAGEDNAAGILSKADLKVWGDYGPIWRLTFSPQQAASFSAVNGEKIEADVTGFIAQYNADWAAAGALWHKALEQYRQRPEDDYDLGSDEYKPDCNISCGVYDSRLSCTKAGGDWSYSTGCR
ncbi:MAG: hypothetical protein AAGA36_05410 [Pseudomonadota bacterium]